MGRFRKKPVEVEAVQFTGGKENVQAIKSFCNGEEGATFFFTKSSSAPYEMQAWNNVKGDDWGTDIVAAVYDYLHETWVGVKKDQWIIRGIVGELYPCDHSTFVATYDAVDNRELGDIHA
jgi:hypothetical protein